MQDSNISDDNSSTDYRRKRLVASLQPGSEGFLFFWGGGGCIVSLQQLCFYF